jgi:hypothetical protein
MDTAAPGIQSSVTVSACTTLVRDVAVYIIDPLEERSMWSIGYVGGIDRGISFGHMPGDDNHGSIGALTATAQTPINPGNFSWVVQSPGLDPGFMGPEVQYLEWGADAPAVIPAQPAGPIFMVDIELEDAVPGDSFDFYLLDFISVWDSGIDGGAFSTQGPNVTLDTGGDAVPDGTSTIYGSDPDSSIPVPPAAFLVDYIDGSPGPATIEVIATAGDLDGDGAVGVTDLLDLLAAWGPCDNCDDCPADLGDDCNVGIADLLVLLAAWGAC